MVQSRALEVNIADYHVDVAVDPKYAVLQEAFARYYGLQESLTTFLKELSHPYKNWEFIVKEARSYSLDYFHLLQGHPRGPEAAEIFVDLFLRAIETSSLAEVRGDAVDNLLLFLQKMAQEAREALPGFLPVLDRTFRQILKYPDDVFGLFLKSYYQINRLAAAVAGQVSAPGLRPQNLNRLVIRYYQTTFDTWLAEEDPQTWFLREVEAGPEEEATFAEVFQPVSHRQMRVWRDELDRMMRCVDLNAPEVLEKLLRLPGYSQIVNSHRGIPHRLSTIGSPGGQGNLYRLLFLFYQMNVTGLSMIQEEALRDINRTLTWIMENEKPWNIRRLIAKTFSILRERAGRFPATALNCVLNMGQGVYRTRDDDLINFFIDQVIELGFQSPMIGGVGNDWQIKVNTAHLQNVRTWMELIELSPPRSTRLISYLIIHLSLCGIFIKDTDLFPRDITHLLNSGISPVYSIVKQLARLFPVYFNDIGAEGRLRDISTHLDEITQRKDGLTHFLRKQCHVESSNRMVGFMEAVLAFWRTRQRELLLPYLPPNIFNQIRAQGPMVDGVHRAMQVVEARGLTHHDLLRLPEAELQEMLAQVPDLPERDRERVLLAVALYRLLNQKYNIGFVELGSHIAQLRAEGFPHLQELEAALEVADPRRRLEGLLAVAEKLKAIVLSPERFEIREDIYKKRHFTIDIPSMYGSYHEMKFNALGLSFRIESLINVLFEKLVAGIDLSLITRATFHQINRLLVLFERALRLEGIFSVELERQLELLAHALEARGFTFTQFLDIFKGFAQAVKNIINDHFNNVHEQNLDGIIRRTPQAHIQPKFLPAQSEVDPEKLPHRISEIFFRDLISLSLGLRQLDLFLSRILNTLFHQSARVPKDRLHRLLNYDPQRAVTSLVEPNPQVDGIILLGNKGLNMMKLRSFGFPVPPGFIITTEIFRCLEIIESYPAAEANFREQVQRHIALLETHVGGRFGDPANPLLFSVRSGSSISQPGMMDTFLNVGMNEAVAEGLAQRSGNPWFAWDNYRRFLQCWGMSFDLKRDDFDTIISDFKQRLGIPFKKGFTGAQMKDVALTYKRMVRESGVDIPEDLSEQLIHTIKRIFRSWHSAKAKTYRRIMGISDDWGTAVTVQQMVFGNRSQNAGSGVIFTHSPRWSGDRLRLWGDFSIENQGEDVVSGLVTTLPISVIQQETEMRETDITLETHFPDIYQGLMDYARSLVYDHGWSPQEMEFTFESATRQDLYLLQSRDMAIRERKRFLAFDLKDLAEREPLGHGIGVSGGAMSGRLVFTLGEISRWREREPHTALILVRADTVPDDIQEIFAADGLLTARGGLTSHAAVVAHRLGRTGVVGCGSMICNEKERRLQFGKVVLSSGDCISIDGQEGSVYQGLIKLEER